MYEGNDLIATRPNCDGLCSYVSCTVFCRCSLRKRMSSARAEKPLEELAAAAGYGSVM